jgi:integrase
MYQWCITWYKKEPGMATKRDYPSPQKRDNGYWYFHFTDLDGIRKQRGTGCTRKIDANRVIRDFIDKINNGCDMDTTLGEEIALYKSIDTNPKYQQALISDIHYSERHAYNQVHVAEELHDVLKRTRYMATPLIDITRADLKFMASLIVKKKGSTSLARSIYKLLKSIMNAAAEDGLIPSSPAYKLPDIRYEKKRRHSLPAEEISAVMARPDIFYSETVWRLFVLLATTGMRRGEAVVLTRDQIKDGTIIIDRALSNWRGDIGSPKWGKKRTIPMAGITKQIIEEQLKENSFGPIFRQESGKPINEKWVEFHFNNFREKAAEICKDNKEGWETLTPHILRHSLNTNLRVSGVPDFLICEYMSWKSQGVNAVQEGYSHAKAEQLRPVADMIDRLYSIDGQNAVKEAEG